MSSMVENRDLSVGAAAALGEAEGATSIIEDRNETMDLVNIRATITEVRGVKASGREILIKDRTRVVNILTTTTARSTVKPQTVEQAQSSNSDKKVNVGRVQCSVRVYFLYSFQVHLFDQPTLFVYRRSATRPA